MQWIEYSWQIRTQYTKLTNTLDIFFPFKCALVKMTKIKLCWQLYFLGDWLVRSPFLSHIFTNECYLLYFEEHVCYLLCIKKTLSRTYKLTCKCVATTSIYYKQFNWSVCSREWSKYSNSFAFQVIWLFTILFARWDARSHWQIHTYDDEKTIMIIGQWMQKE